MEWKEEKLSEVVFYGGSDCSKCHQLLPYIEHLVQVKHAEHSIKFRYIDCQALLDSNELIEPLKTITTIPTVVYYDEDGNELMRIVDIQPIDTYENYILYYL